MLEQVGEHDHVEALGRGGREGLERLLGDRQAEHVARVAGGRARELQPEHVVAHPARLVEQQAVAAADVEQAPRAGVAGDQLEHAAGGRAPSRLLAEVGVVGHLAVEVVQLGARGQARLLHGAAGRAAQQRAVLAGPVVARGEVLG